MRRLPCKHNLFSERFQSTHSAGNATFLTLRLITSFDRFQSTHSAGNATDAAVFIFSGYFYFNPRIPQGMRLW